MKRKPSFSFVLFTIVFIFQGNFLNAENPNKNIASNIYYHSESIVFNRFKLGIHNDSIHKLNFRYHDKKRGLKPYIAPVILISAGTALHFSDAKYNFQDWMQDNFAYSGDVDDYIQYAPLVAVYSLNAVGIKGKNNFGNRTALALKSFLLNDLIVNNLKNWTDTERPNGANNRSFPSGHTSFAFAMAHFMHKEYGEQSIWYSIGAYSCAATVGLMRVSKNAHWISDVVAGAGIGMLSTELAYLTHLYKWDNEHIKNFDIFPFRIGQQKGLTLVYKF